MDRDNNDIGAGKKRRWVVAALREVAEFFEVSAGTVRTGWRSAGMPGRRGAWNLADILQWREARWQARWQAPPDADEAAAGQPSLASLRSLELFEVWKAKKTNNDKTAAALIDRLAFEQELQSNVSRLQARLAPLAEELLNELPAKLRPVLRERVVSLVKLVHSSVDDCATLPTKT